MENEKFHARRYGLASEKKCTESPKKAAKFIYKKKMEKSRFIVKRGEILSVFLTVFCKTLKNRRRKREIWRTKKTYKEVRDSEREST